MRTVGLTGSIGMGKSTTAEMFRAAGVPVHSSDEAVHRLYRGRAAGPIEARFPGTMRNGAIDRALLSPRVLGNPQAMAALEAIVHPMVREEEEAFLVAAAKAGAPLAVLDMPLLFETGADARVDTVLVVTAPFEIQRERVLSRPGMSREKFSAILARQVPDAEKRARADAVIDTSQGLDAVRREVEALIEVWGGENVATKLGSA